LRFRLCCCTASAGRVSAVAFAEVAAAFAQAVPEFLAGAVGTLLAAAAALSVSLLLNSCILILSTFFSSSFSSSCRANDPCG